MPYASTPENAPDNEAAEKNAEILGGEAMQDDDECERWKKG
jgi:hypothetical protein